MIRRISLAAALGCIAGVAGAWTLDGDASTISYVSIKNAEVAEPNLLPGLSGGVNEDGVAELEIALESVETYVDIRNERMREHLFKVDQYPVATLSAELDLGSYADMEEGGTRDVEFDVAVQANGAESTYPVRATVTRVSADRVQVAALEPVIMYADELGYDAGINTLREIAGLDSIQLAVPVTFTLLFDR